MRRPLVAGNWKMNGTRASVAALIQSLLEMKLKGDVDVAVLPSALHVAQVVSLLGDASIGVGAQDCSVESGFGARTGEVSAAQLLDAGCEWVLVGHSERRLLLGECDELVAAKFAASLGSGLKPILCVGETLEQRELGQAVAVIESQLDAVLAGQGVACFEHAVVAYEPVWAIGTGRTATPEQAQEVHAAIRARIAREDAQIAEGVRILYGGSVKAANAGELFAQSDIDGGLIGGASLIADEFGAICRAAGN